MTTNRQGWPESLAVYVDRLAELRRRASDPNRDAYTAALGQLRALGLIDERTWREALDRERIPLRPDRRERARKRAGLGAP